MDYQDSRFASRKVDSEKESIEKRASRLTLYSLIGATLFLSGFNAATPKSQEEIEKQRIQVQGIYQRAKEDITYLLDKIR